MGPFVLVVAAVLIALALAVGRRDRDRRRAAAATASLEVDDWGVRRMLADGRAEEVGWEEVVEVRVVVLPRGPWDDRLRIVLDGGGERGCIVPLDIAEEWGLLAALGRLPGFDAHLLAQVLDQARTGTHILWRSST